MGTESKLVNDRPFDSAMTEIPSFKENLPGKMNIDDVVESESSNSFWALCNSFGINQLTQDPPHLDYGPMLEMCMTRPKTVHMSVTKNYPGLFGLRVDCVPNGTSLLVSAILVGGEVWDWNNLHSKAAICVNDRIISVNQVTGICHQLVAELREAEHVALTVLHYGSED